jgi:UDP-2,3-diacylglucosamine pyrophosphatase LpxH
LNEVVPLRTFHRISLDKLMSKTTERIQKALDSAFEKGYRIPIGTEDARWIIFSDHHRGRKDGADDFAICEPTYLEALEYYDKEAFTLCLLGDVEELWENHILQILGPYKKVMTKEKDFYEDRRLYRIWGNHDDDWRFAAQIEKHLGWLFKRIPVYESIILELHEDLSCRDILLVHGHQGTLNSDRFAGISRVFVRLIWRNVQRLFKIPLSTPANNIKLKSEHDQAMYHWANSKDRVLICGHTHQPVFMSYTHADELRMKIKAIRSQLENAPSQALEEQLNETHELLETVLSAGGEPMMVESPKPFYFNSGCCSFSDGDITGIEIADKEIRLVKWCNGSFERKVLGRTELRYLMDYC